MCMYLNAKAIIQRAIYHREMYKPPMFDSTVMTEQE